MKVRGFIQVKTGLWALGAIIKYSWLLDGKTIKGAVTNRLSVKNIYKGHKISVRVSESTDYWVLGTASALSPVILIK
jgi:hypothetical protein